MTSTANSTIGAIVRWLRVCPLAFAAGSAHSARPYTSARQESADPHMQAVSTSLPIAAPLPAEYLVPTYHPNPELHAIGLLLCGAEFSDIEEALRMRGDTRALGRLRAAHRGGLISVALAVLRVGAQYTSVAFVVLARGAAAQLERVQFPPRDRRWTLAARLRSAICAQQVKWWDV